MSDNLSLLDCFHTGTFDPLPVEGDTVLCSKCQDYRVVTVVTIEWRIRCTGCRLGKRYGADETGARRAAGTHADAFKHSVKLFRGASQVGLIAAPDAPLPGTLGWVRAHPEHQSVLRSSGQDQT